MYRSSWLVMFGFSILCGLSAATLVAKPAGGRHLVIAQHVNAAEVWAGTGPDRIQLENAVLARCERIMKRGCSVTRSVSEGSVAVVRRADGALVTAAGNSNDDASQNAMTFCQNSGFYCEIMQVRQVPENPKKLSLWDPRYPAKLINRYSAIAIQVSPTSPSRLWVASGRLDATLAKTDALANCQADAREGCQLMQQSANSTVSVFFDHTTGGLRQMQGKDLKQALDYQNRFCLEKNLKCETKLIVDGRAEETSVHAIGR